MRNAKLLPFAVLVALMPSLALAISGAEACRLFESLGNRDPVHRQACLYQELPPDPHARRAHYLLWFMEDYGPYSLGVAAAGVSALLEIAEKVPTPAQAVTLTFTDSQLDLGSNYTAQLNASEIHACMKRGGEPERTACLANTISARAQGTEFSQIRAETADSAGQPSILW